MKMFDSIIRWSAVTCLVALTACSPQIASPVAKNIAAMSEGGVNGGGGGTLPAKPITISELVPIVKDARSDLRLFVLHEMARFDREKASQIENKLYGGNVTLWDIIQKTDVEIREDRPCFDSIGKPVDGSIFASQSGSICMSAYNMAPKLIIERARTEVVALMAHEFSHILGANENEARTFQAFVSDDLTQRGNETIAKFRFENNYYKFDQIISRLKHAVEMGPESIQENISTLGWAWSYLADFMSITCFNSGKADEFCERYYFTVKESQAEYFQFSLIRYKLALDFLDEKYRFPGTMPYSKRFDGIETLTFEQACKNHGIIFSPLKGNLGMRQISKLHSTDEAYAVLREFVDYLGRVDDYLAALQNNRSRIPDLP